MLENQHEQALPIIEINMHKTLIHSAYIHQRDGTRPGFLRMATQGVYHRIQV